MWMELGEAWEEVEEDLWWRSDEIRFFHNCVERLEGSQERERLRRALVLFLYGHLEGHFRFVLLVYVAAVNSRRLRCGEACDPLVSSAAGDLLSAVRSSNRRVEFEYVEEPQESRVRSIARDQELVARFRALDDEVLVVPDGAVATESNLKPRVVLRALHRLGLEYGFVEQWEGELQHLLRLRNAIAHGDERRGVSEEKYGKLRVAVMALMREVRVGVMRALEKESYRRARGAGSD